MKKVLSFVLVLAMVLGSVAMVFAANNTFADDTAITNKEASAVLAAAGVIEGYTDGTFKPAGILTRAEGAAIAARLVLGKADAAKLTTVVGPFNDVPASHWAAGYISYCSAQGYLNGYGNGNFGPEDTLTVAQFGKMMLTLLGYKSENEGFVGDAWETNVGSVMVKAGLTDGVTLSGSNACSREVAAQVALNTLKGELVKYDGNPTTVSTGSVTVTTGQSAAKKDDWQSGDKESYKNETKPGGAKPGNVRFMNRYQKDLKLGTTTSDDFGRPDTNKWTYKGESVYTAKSSSNKIGTYTNKQDEKVIYNLLDDHDALKDTTSLVIKEDGNTVATSNALKAYAAAWKTSTNKIGNSGNGEQIEVYYDSTVGTDGAVTIVMYNYYLVKATADYSASNKKVKIEWISTRPGIAPFEIEQKDFDVENVKEDDYLVVTVANNKIKSCAPAAKVTGNISAYTENSNITVDGTKYTKAAKFDKDVNSAFSELKTGSDVTLIVDPNNYVLATKDETSSNQYVYIYRVGQSTNLDEDDKAIAYFVDGTRQTITLDNTDVAVANTWFNYSVKSNGKYKLTALTTSAVAKGKYVVSANGAALTGDAIHYTDIATTNPGVANNATVFLTLKAKDDKKNANTYTSLKGPKAATTASFSAVIKDGKALYVFAIAGGFSGANSSDYVLIYNGPKSSFDKVTSGDSEYQEYGKTFLNGTQQTTQFSTSHQMSFTATAALFGDLSYDSDGRVEKGTQAVTESALGVKGVQFLKLDATVNNTQVSYSDGVITVAGKAFKIADTAAAYVINGGDVENPSLKGIKGTMDEGASYLAFFVFEKEESDLNKLVVKTVYFVK